MADIGIEGEPIFVLLTDELPVVTQSTARTLTVESSEWLEEASA